MSSYVLHIGDKTYSSWSLRPWLLLKTLNIPFEEYLHPFGDKTTRQARYQQFSPTGKVPCLHHNNLTIWDSLAVIEYLAEQHSQIYPSEIHARTWSRCAIAEMHAGFTSLRQHCPMDCTRTEPLNDIPDSVQVDLDRIQALWLHGFELFGGPYLAGKDFTAVDAYFAPVALRIQQYQLTIHPLCQKWINQMMQLDAIKQWLHNAALEQTL